MKPVPLQPNLPMPTTTFGNPAPIAQYYICPHCKQPAQHQSAKLILTKTPDGFVQHAGWDDLPVWTKVYYPQAQPAREPLTAKEIAEFVGTHEYGPEQLKWFRLGEAAHGITKGNT